MTFSRRDFVKSASLAAAASALGAARSFGREGENGKPQKVLVLGGTAFLGPPIVDGLVAAGHTVTLFNRGKTNPKLFPTLEKLIGDRHADVKSLEGREFDVVIDTNAYFPRDVVNPLGALKSVGHYVLVSTCSVYPGMAQEKLDESSEVATISDEEIESATKANKIGMLYGALKVACERAAEKALPGKVTVVRPGLIVGPGDTTDRFTYWPVRVAKGGDMIAPGKPEWTIQFTDVRDVADFCVHTGLKRLAGIFNVNGLERPVPMGKFLEACKKVSKSDANFVWIDAQFLADHKVQAWADLPDWFPPPEGKDEVAVLSSEKAIANGLKFRPLETTIEDTLEFHKSRGESYKPTWRLTPEREAEVLKAWREKG